MLKLLIDVFLSVLHDDAAIVIVYALALQVEALILVHAHFYHVGNGRRVVVVVEVKEFLGTAVNSDIGFVGRNGSTALDTIETHHTVLLAEHILAAVGSNRTVGRSLQFVVVKSPIGVFIFFFGKAIVVLQSF